MDSLPASTSERKTTIPDLNDDCLLHVFEHLDLDDLCAVADVCSRFRQNAQAHFAHSKMKDSYVICLRRDDQPYVYLLRASKVLRNFGAFIRKIEADSFGFSCERLFELLSRYCSEGSLIELVLNSCMIDTDIAHLQPVFLHLRKLTIRDGKQSEFLINLLPEWSPELLELTIHNKCFPQLNLQKNFRKLEKLVLKICEGYNSHTIDSLLIRTPQLKHFRSSTYTEVDHGIFPSMVRHVPQIEAIRCKVLNTNGMEPIGQLRNLKSLGICSKSNGIASILRKITATNMQLEHLVLTCIPSLEYNALIAEILKMKKLKALELIDFRNLPQSNLTDICRNLSELVELSSGYIRENSMSADRFVELIRNAEKLRLLCGDVIFEDGIDDAAYMKMVNIVMNRREKAPLKICLHEVAGLSISEDLTREYEHILAFESWPNVHTGFRHHSDYN